METWLSRVGYQNGFTRAHAFEGGRDGSMAKFVSVAPRLSLTGMSADQWIAAKPGTEYMLALAMAQVILAERSEEHTSELQSRPHLVCRLLLETKKHSAPGST